VGATGTTPNQGNPGNQSFGGNSGGFGNGAGNQGGGFGNSNQAPAAGRTCVHGEMNYKEAKPGSGKDWRAYFCPTPQGTVNQCKPVFLKPGES
jgi:hypothetical protein